MRTRRFPVSLLLGVLAGTPPACAATFIVDTTADAVDAAPGDGACATGAGTCTLRAAIQEANALAGRDTVMLADLTYTLAIAPAAPLDETTGDLDIRDGLDLVGGPAGGTIVDGNRLDRIFLVGAGVAVTITGVTIENGFVPPIGEGGGAILNLGDLTLTDGAVLSSSTDLGGGIFNAAGSVLTLDGCSIRDNQADDAGGGIRNEGTVRVAASEVFNNTGGRDGGGVANAGELAVSGSTIIGNRAVGRGTLPGDGGGLANELVGVATITDTFIKLNAAGGQGGGILNAGSLTLRGSAIKVNAAVAPGGGIANSGTLGVVNTSVSTNSTAVAGGGISTSGTVSLNNATVVFNTSAGEAGGISQTDGTVTVSNTILAANTAPAGAECKGTLASAGYNLVGDPDGCTIGGDPTGNMMGQDPRLAPPAANGGPTPNHALLAGSPAINAGNPAPPGSVDGACAPTDQRGVARPQGGRCDIGAYETLCGDGVVEPAPDATGEECDGGGCCSPACVSLPAGHGCTDDADLCTEDRCDDGGACRHFVNGYAGVDCELAELLQPGICGGDAPRASLRRMIAREVARARALVKKAAGASSGKADRRLGKAIARLDTLQRTVSRARTISATCRATLQTLVEQRRELIVGLRPAPTERRAA